ncbi:MAG TPA: hypothetical protein VKQ71_11225 [Acidimicrobiales bacterium]|nr:hypothetical protein [Acidimicrobiales bacterium]
MSPLSTLPGLQDNVVRSLRQSQELLVDTFTTSAELLTKIVNCGLRPETAEELPALLADVDRLNTMGDKLLAAEEALVLDVAAVGDEVLPGIMQPASVDLVDRFYAGREKLIAAQTHLALRVAAAQRHTVPAKREDGVHDLERLERAKGTLPSSRRAARRAASYAVVG